LPAAKPPVTSTPSCKNSRRVIISAVLTLQMLLEKR
jgi:hypothetical protein